MVLAAITRSLKTHDVDLLMLGLQGAAVVANHRNTCTNQLQAKVTATTSPENNSTACKHECNSYRGRASW